MFDINKYSKFKNKINYIVLENEPIDLERVHDNDTDDKKNSKLIHDFNIRKLQNSIHVLNAISPAFTASFELADLIISESNISIA